MISVQHRTAFGTEHYQYRDAIRRFIARDLLPLLPKWQDDGKMCREGWLRAGAAGFLCPTVAEAYGGLGLDFRFNAVFNEEVSYALPMTGYTLQSDIVVNYIERFAAPHIRQRLLPRMIAGACVVAVAMTEPDAGSDLRGIKTKAVPDGEGYVIDGSKTYITNGQNADVTIVVARTSPDGSSRALSLILVESDRPGFSRGRKLDKIGQDIADTSELFFDQVRVPKENLLGEEGAGLVYLIQNLSQERLSIAITAQAAAQRAFDVTLDFVKDRKAFGSRVLDFQNTQFTLANIKTDLQVGWIHIDDCILRHIRGELGAEEAAAAKLWHTEMQWRTVDACLQLHGGAGYMNEYEIARLWKEARVQRIYGGTSEIMKLIIGRSL